MLHYLSVAYREGKNPTKSAFYRDLAIPVLFRTLEEQAPCPWSTFMLAWCYDCGEGVEKDSNRAKDYFLLAANQGHITAQANLALHYLTNQEEKDTKKALMWFERASGQGDACSMMHLGTLYKQVEGDDAQAVAMFKQSVIHGHTAALNSLALCYERGQGVAVDKEKAFSFYAEAAAFGTPSALYNLAICYKIGFVCEKDEMIAAQLYVLSSDKGHAEANNALYRLYESAQNPLLSGLKVLISYQYGLNGEAQSDSKSLEIYLDIIESRTRESQALPFVGRTLLRTSQEYYWNLIRLLFIGYLKPIYSPKTQNGVSETISPCFFAKLPKSLVQRLIPFFAVRVRFEETWPRPITKISLSDL